MTQGQGFGEARALLDGPLDRGRWEGLCAWVEGGPAARLEERVAYLNAQIDRRPWAERVVCAAPLLWKREIQAEDVQPKHRVVRSVGLRDTYGIGRVLRSTHLDNVEQVRLSNPGKRGVMALTKAACAPRLRSLVLVITYMGLYGVPVPASYTPPDDVHPLVRERYAALARIAWGELDGFEDANGRSRVWGR